MINAYDFIIILLVIVFIVLIIVYYKKIKELITATPGVTTTAPPPGTTTPGVTITPMTESPKTSQPPPPSQPPPSTGGIPIPGGVVLNLKTAKINFQEYAKGRLEVVDNVLTASLNPTDGNGEGKNKDSREVSKKQRNEISVKDSSFAVQNNQTGTWACYLKVNQKIDWTKGYYHLLQIKYNLVGGNPDKKVVNPIFAVSINNNNLCVRDETGKYTTIMPLAAAVGKWIPVIVTATYKNNGPVKYTVNGISGTMTFAKAETELYFKAGQYRQWPNDINIVTSSSYKDISFKLNK